MVMSKPGRGRPKILNHALPPAKDHVAVRLGLMLTLSLLERELAEVNPDNSVAPNAGAIGLVTDKELDLAIDQIIHVVEEMMGWRNVLCSDTPDLQSFFRAGHEGFQDPKTFRMVEQEVDERGRRNLIYHGDDADARKLDEERVGKSKSERRRSVKAKIKKSVKRFLELDPAHDERLLIELFLIVDEYQMKRFCNLKRGRRQ